MLWLSGFELYSRWLPLALIEESKNRTKVEPPVSFHGRWAFTGIETQGASSEKRSRHIYFMEG